MQAIKILSPVNLTSGLSIPSGSIVVIAEGYADVKGQTKPNPSTGQPAFIPAQIATFVFASVQALTEGKAPIQGIEDFNTTFSGLELSVASYEILSAETLLVTSVYGELEKIYPEQVEIVNL
jgi:hypothetical protein